MMACTDQLHKFDPVYLSKLCINKFNKLPKTGKPILDKEWTVLSCIVKYQLIDDQSTPIIEVVSLGTGTKSIGSNKLCKNGFILNDSHAEIIARRGFLRYLLHEIDNLLSSSSINSSITSTTTTTTTTITNPINQSTLIFKFDNETKKITLKSNVSFHFVSTHIPCGDASIYNIKSDATVEESNDDDGPPLMKKIKVDDIGIEIDDSGKKNFSGGKIIQMANDQTILNDRMAQNLGVIRTKPGRGIQTLSASCSDKLSKWNFIGIQGGILSCLLDEPIYLASITIIDNIKNSINLQLSIRRAIWERWDNENVQLMTPFVQQRPAIYIVDRNECESFTYFFDERLTPSSCSIIWCNVIDKPLEVSVAGKRQGITKKDLNLSTGCLRICKYSLFQQFTELIRNYSNIFQNINTSNCYQSVKNNYAKSYVEAWTTLRVKYFKKWIVKPNDLCNFMVK